MKIRSNRLKSLVLICTLSALSAVAACKSDNNGDSPQPSSGGGTADSMGVGPITAKITVDAKVDAAMAAKGKSLFESRCTACHKLDARYVGPALAGVTKRRRPEWIMNMILNPGEMTQKDETAEALLAEYLTQMANQNLTQDEARMVLEFFRRNDGSM
jgi:mono/diheme cytochrome c family protein